jgi:hypothetical protein
MNFFMVLSYRKSLYAKEDIVIHEKKFNGIV